jgi:hypothetical protein
MSDRYKGGILSGTAPTVTPQSANGVYTASQQYQYQGQGVWPTAAQNPILQSLRFRSSASAYLNRTPASASNRRTWTWSGWVKRGTLGAINDGIFAAGTSFGTNNNDLQVITFNNDTLTLVSENGGSTQYNLVTSQVFRDPAAWYHIVVALDTTQATSSNRVKLYVNGTQVTAFSTATYPSLNYDGWVNSANQHRIGSRVSPDFDGYMTEINFIDGQALTPSSFGTTDANGIWQPTPYTGTYGTNGFYLPFSDKSALTTSSNVGLGKDFSGNGNYWTTNNISITAGSTYDPMLDSPSNASSTIANYAVLNPLFNPAGMTLSDGNLKAVTVISHSTVNSSIGVTSGKWYAEFTLIARTDTCGIGITNVQTPFTSYPGTFAGGWWAYNNNTSLILLTPTTGYGYASAMAAGQVWHIALDMDNGNCWLGYNGSWYNAASSGTLGGGNPSTGANPTFTGIPNTSPIYMFLENVNCTWGSNFGQQPFSFTPPTGFNRLNTYNLPVPTIPAGNKQMDATLYTGTGATQSITNSGSMQPDFVWGKVRSTTEDNILYDSLRGAGYILSSNTTAAEINNVGFNLTSFNSNGFSLASGNQINQSGQTNVAWQWKANGAAVTNTAGTISSQVSANTTSGFSVVTYTGTGSVATVGHGLGVAPSMVIVKQRNTAQSWCVWHTSIGSANVLFLNSTSASTSYPTLFNSMSTLNSTVFSIGTDIGTNQNTGTYVAYCFAQIAGYSAFGSYTGNGSADGPFVFTGFRPRFVMIKKTDTTSDWWIWDTSRNTYNQMNTVLYPNLSSAEVADPVFNFDVLSNGFKNRSSNATVNGSGATYIYAAFAENPFKMARAR